MSTKRKAEILLVLAAFLWGGTFVSIKLVVSETDPGFFLFLRFIAASIISFFYFRNKNNQEVPNRSFYQATFWIGSVAFIGYLLQTIGLVYTTATQSGFITGSYVVFVPLFQIWIEKKPPSKQLWIAVLLVFLGLALVSQNEVDLESGFSFSKGDFLTLVSAIFFALYIILVDIFSKRYSPNALVEGQIYWLTFFSGLYLAFSLGMKKTISFQWNWVLVASVAYTAFFATFVTNYIQAHFQKAVSPTQAGIIFSLEPVFSFFIAYLVLNEVLGLIGVLGCLLVFFGVLLSEKKGDQSKEKSNVAT